MNARRIFLIALSFAACSTMSAPAAEPKAGTQVEQVLVVGDAKMDYLLYLPEGYGEDKQKRWPLVLFLHGRGESFGPLSLVAKWGPPKFAARGDKLNYVLVSPQCPGKDSWSRETQQTRLTALLDHIEESFAVDKDRVYLTGLSMGGYGTWRMAAEQAGRFAAAAPICGGGNEADAEKLKNLPIWVFHGDKDRAVAFERSASMVNAIRKAGGEQIRFTTLENVGHNSWSAAYATPELMQWMMQQKRRAN